MDELLPVAVVLVAFALAAAAWIACKRHLSARGLSHAAIFAGLCRVHGLDKATRRLLRRFVRRIKCLQPARVFVDPALLENAAAAGLPARETERLQLLGEELFAEPRGFDIAGSRP